MNKNELTGKTEDHLNEFQGFPFHKNIIADLKDLSRRAKEDNFEIGFVSSYRSYERQLNIWNSKALGQRKLLDNNENELDYSSLSKEEIVFSILRWSALPGFSRHHWGTDFDIYEKNSLPSDDYQIQLAPSEVEGGGIFAKFHDWLDGCMKDKNFPFFRPYSEDLGGVSPERWHISHRNESKNYHESLTLNFFEEFIKESEIELKEIVLENSKDIFDRYIVNINS